jgi:hypothetical protein
MQLRGDAAWLAYPLAALRKLPPTPEIGRLGSWFLPRHAI